MLSCDQSHPRLDVFGEILTSSCPRPFLGSRVSSVFLSCSKDTFDENIASGLFGLTMPSWSFVKNITAGMPLFLYNLSEKRFYGVFEAVRFYWRLSLPSFSRLWAHQPCPCTSQGLDRPLLF